MTEDEFNKSVQTMEQSKPEAHEVLGSKEHSRRQQEAILQELIDLARYSPIIHAVLTVHGQGGTSFEEVQYMIIRALFLYQKELEQKLLNLQEAKSPIILLKEF